MEVVDLFAGVGSVYGPWWTIVPLWTLGWTLCRKRYLGFFAMASTSAKVASCGNLFSLRDFSSLLFNVHSSR